jgi:hypothetical protein
MARNNWLFFYCSNNVIDKVNGFEKLENNLYLTNQYDLINSTLENFVYILSSTNPMLSLIILNL